MGLSPIPPHFFPPRRDYRGSVRAGQRCWRDFFQRRQSLTRRPSRRDWIMKDARISELRRLVVALCQNPARNAPTGACWNCDLRHKASPGAGRRMSTGPVQRWESAGKPGSVLDSHSSGMHVAVHLKRPTREHARAARCRPRQCRRRPVPLFGLAPGGVCRAVPVARPAVRSYRTVSPLPATGEPVTSAVCSLLHFPWARAPQALPGALPCGARTFLPRTSRGRLPGRLPRPR